MYHKISGGDLENARMRMLPANNKCLGPEV